MKAFYSENKFFEKSPIQTKTFNIKNMQTNVTQTNESSFNNNTVNQANLTRNIIKYNYSNNSTSNNNIKKLYPASTNNNFKNLNKNFSCIIPLIKQTSYTFGETNNSSNNSFIKQNRNSINCPFKLQNLNDFTNIGTYPDNRKLSLKKITPKIIQQKRNEQFKVHLCKKNINNDEDKLIIENINNMDNDDKYSLITNTKSKYGGIINPYIFNHNVFFGKSFLDINSWNNSLLKNILPENIDSLSNIIGKNKRINKSERTLKKYIKLENMPNNGSFFNSKISKFCSNFNSKNNLIKENSKINYNMNNSITRSIKKISNDVSNNCTLRKIPKRIIKQGDNSPVKIFNYRKIENDNINVRNFKKLNHNVPRNLCIYSLYNLKMYS